MSAEQNLTDIVIYCIGGSTNHNWLSKDSKGSPHIEQLASDANMFNVTYATVNGTSGYYINVAGDDSAYLTGEAGSGDVTYQTKTNASLWCFSKVKSASPQSLNFQIVGQAGSLVYLYGTTNSSGGSLKMTSDTSSVRNNFLIMTPETPSC